VVHNHPSGDPSPSPEDVAVTRQLVAAGRLLDIEVLDHLVVGQQRFVSLRERGLGFE
jgi:DNA repair protein RadC